MRDGYWGEGNAKKSHRSVTNKYIRNKWRVQSNYIMSYGEEPDEPYPTKREAKQYIWSIW